MKSVRRFLVLTPVAFGVTAVASVIYLMFVDTWQDMIGFTLRFVIGATVAVLAAILVAGGLLRLLGVRNDWAALGLAFVLVAVVWAIRNVTDEPWRGDDEEWDLLFLAVAAIASIPAWLAYAGGLLVGDLRDRRSRKSAGSTA
jgi:hypothetical protein